MNTNSPYFGVIDEIAAERSRQIEEEGWTPEHDDTYTQGELALAAGCYAIVPCLPDERFNILTRCWPWHKRWWKPTNRRRNLVKAGALIVAEIERLDRLSKKEQTSETSVHSPSPVR